MDAIKMKTRKNDRVRMKRDFPLDPIIEGDMIDIPFNDIVGVEFSDLQYCTGCWPK
jgi:hypothetical protein